MKPGALSSLGRSLCAPPHPSVSGLAGDAAAEQREPRELGVGADCAMADGLEHVTVQLLHVVLRGQQVRQSHDVRGVQVHI